MTDSLHGSGVPKRCAVIEMACSCRKGSSSIRPAVVTSPAYTARSGSPSTAIASTSALSEMAKGMSLEDAARITPKQIMNYLNGLPDTKVHCSVLGDKALRAAIEDYYRRNGIEIDKTERPARIICDCIGVTDRDIMDAARDGAVTWNELQQKTKIGTVCGKCQTQAMEVLDESLFEIHHETLKMHD